jgi:hypothetical protein
MLCKNAIYPISLIVIDVNFPLSPFYTNLVHQFLCILVVVDNSLGLVG